MKKLLTFLTLLTLFFGVGWAETKTATLSWAGNGSNDASQALTTSNILNANGGGYYNGDANLATCTETSRVYCASSGNGLKFGTGSYSGSLTFSITGSLKPSKITVSAKRYSSSEASLSVDVNGSNKFSSTSLTSGFADYEIAMDGNTTLNTIKIYTTNKRAYVDKITITYEEGGSQQTSHNITYAEVTGGSFSGPASAAEGAEVTIQATPADGYNFDSWNVTDASGAITVTDNKFTMGTRDVTVSGTFVAKPTYTISVTNGSADLTTAYEGQTVTLTPNIPSGQVVDWDATTVSPSSVVIDHSNYTFTMPGQNVTVTFAFKDDPSANAIFYESFNDYEFQGGNDENFSQGSGTFSNESNDLDWTNTSTVYGANHCIRMGSSGNNGSITSPAVGQIADETALHFRLAGWSSGTNTLTVTIDGGGTFSDGTTSKSYTATNSSWADITAELINLTANTTITFSGKRFFLDEIILEKPVEKAHTITSTASPSAGGFVTCKSSADSGEAISFTITTNSNYEFAYVEVKDANDNDVEFTEENGTYSFTMPESDVTITAHFNQAGTLYILGEANGKFDNADWQPNEGTLMTYSNGKYTARVYFKGYTKYNNGDGYSEFAFSKKLATKTAANGGWDEINWDGSRYGSGAEGSYWGIGGEGQSAFGSTIPLYNHSQKSYRVPAGVYDIEVDLQADPNTVKVTPVNLTVTLDPASGTYNKGKEIAISSNLTSLIAATGSNETVTISHKIGDGEYENGNSVVLNDAGENITVTGMATLGHIKVTGTGTYTIENKYSVTIDDGISNGQVSVSSNNVAPGTEVTITATPSAGYSLGSITVTDANNNPITVTDGKFIMPESNVVVSATFTINSYSITTVPTNCSVDVASTAVYNSQVTFTVNPRSDKYEVSSVTVTYGDGRTKPVTDNGDGTYSFYMPDDNVTLTVICTRKSTGGNQFTLVKSQTDIVAGGEYVILNAATTQAMTKTSSNNYDAYSTQYNLDGEIVTLTEGSDVSILKFIDGSTTGTFKIQDGNLYLTAASKKLNATANGSDWTVTLGSDNNVTIQSGNWVIKNNANYFRCYDSSTGTLVKLYKRLPAGVSVEIDPTTGNVIGSQVVNVGSDTDGALVQYKVEKQNGSNWDVVTDWTEWTTYTEANGPLEFTITGNVGDVYQVTARAKEADQVVDPDEEEDFDEQTVQYTFVAPAAPTITPASCAISSETQSVSIASDYVATGGVVEYSTDGGTTWNTYEGAFNVVIEGVGQSVTVQARVTVNGVTSEVATATYTRNVQPVVFSPASGGTYYGDQTCQMFSTTKGARIYYTTDGSDPVMNQGTTQLYTGEISMPATDEYTFKAVAYIGTTPSTITSANYTVEAKSAFTGGNGNYIYSVAELNGKTVGTVTINGKTYMQTTEQWTMVNPVQVIWMSTYQNRGNYPEYCLMRDNTGYGMVYFGKNNTNHASCTQFAMGDWIGGGYYGLISYAYSNSDGDGDGQIDGQLDYHPEFGTSASGQQIYNWPSTVLSNDPVLPEYLTIPEILASATAGNTDYWGHYVHLRKTTIELTKKDNDGKWSGDITAENEIDHILYYDKFYLQYGGDYSDWTTTNNLFYGHPNRTFDVYGFVSCHLTSETPYQISPFDFAWIDKPICDHETGDYTSAETVTLSSPEDPTATIWYKTSDMDDYAVYTEPFEVNSTTTIEWYATKQSQYNDELESKFGSITMTFVELPVPVISPESQVLPIANNSYVDATIEFNTTLVPTGAVIVYTTDGSDPKTSNNVYVANETTLHFTTTTTVRAITRIGEEGNYLYSAEADAKTYTFVKSNGIKYTLIDDVTKLKDNGVYVIVSQNYSEALSTTQNENNRGAAGVLFVENTNMGQVYGNDDVAQFTLTVLSHDEDTSPERRFLMQTNNSSENGYLYVGSETNNTLLTEAEEDAMGNDVAVITIDSDGRAHIHFNYAGGDNRYLQYWNRDRLFNTYKSEYYDRAVYIYGIEATPLATIEKEGVNGNDYTVADELVGVYASGKLLWCKDQGNVSINKSELNRDNGEIDFLHDVVGNPFNTAWEDCDQSNWVILDFSDVTEGKNDAEYFVNKFIAPATVTGTYNKGTNYTIKLKTAPNDNEGSPSFTKNIFVASSFAEVYQAGVNNRRFLNPKGTEVHTLTFAVWDGTNFTTPSTTDLPGVVSVDWTYNESGNVSETLEVGTQYEFIASVGFAAASNSPRLKAEAQTSNTFKVQPLNLTSENVITAINTVDVTGKAVKSVKYVNVAGVMSDVPFEGVNIVVTEYTDGSRTTSKMLCK